MRVLNRIVDAIRELYPEPVNVTLTKFGELGVWRGEVRSTCLTHSHARSEHRTEIGAALMLLHDSMIFSQAIGTAVERAYAVMEVFRNEVA